MSLHEVDVINSRQQGFLALFSGETTKGGGPRTPQVQACVSQSHWGGIEWLGF